jgi:hypothetical protein
VVDCRPVDMATDVGEGAIAQLRGVHGRTGKRSLHRKIGAAVAEFLLESTKPRQSRGKQNDRPAKGYVVESRRGRSVQQASSLIGKVALDYSQKPPPSHRSMGHATKETDERVHQDRPSRRKPTGQKCWATMPFSTAGGG